MVDEAMRARFEAAVECARPPLAEAPLTGIAALMTAAAFVVPAEQVAIFDAIAEAVAATPDMAARAAHIAQALPWTVAGRPRVALPSALWDSFWAVIDRPPEQAVDPLAFTLQVVAMGQHYDAALIDRCEAALLAHPCVHDLLAQPEVRMKTSDLDGLPPASLGTILLQMLRAQGYDLEVIDADSVVLPGPWPAQNRTNRRILQLHDVWHLVAGYGFTGAGEVAISGFQMAQFGQNYSTRFLATVASIAALNMPPLADLLLPVMFDGWRHGRSTPPLIALSWHELIARDMDDIRREFGISLFDSPTARLMEAMPMAGAA
jgi:ubiquinone biosynthesis protein Coq4